MVKLKMMAQLLTLGKERRWEMADFRVKASFTAILTEWGFLLLTSSAIWWLLPAPECVEIC